MVPWAFDVLMGSRQTLDLAVGLAEYLHEEAVVAGFGHGGQVENFCFEDLKGCQMWALGDLMVGPAVELDNANLGLVSRDSYRQWLVAVAGVVAPLSSR
jgi:hypothetical protein